MNSLSIGTYRLNYFELLLSLAAGHIIIGNPFFGAAVFLFADIVKAYSLCNIQRIRRSDGSSYLPKLFLAIVLLVGAAVAFMYPAAAGIPKANLVSLFALCIVFRDYLCAVPAVREGDKDFRHWLFIAAAQLVFDAFCAALIFKETGLQNFLLIIAVAVLTGVHKVFLPDKSVTAGASSVEAAKSGGRNQKTAANDDAVRNSGAGNPEAADLGVENKFSEIASYRIFSNMSLYSTIAMNLGIMMYFCYSIFRGNGTFDIRTYAAMALWLLIVNLILFLCDAIIRKQWLGLALAEFIAGVITWVLGAVFMFRAREFAGRMVWTFVWGMGIALISSSISRFNLDFTAVGKLSDKDLDADDLVVSNVIVTLIAAVISSFIMLIFMAVWTFSARSLSSDEMPMMLNISLMATPIVFMALALAFALRQPLDYRNREKLMLYIENRTDNEKEKESLQNLFVRKYRMRFGVKILLTLARPFLRLKVSGLEKLRKECYPSVFVSNHGFIYGPIAAVIYLPTYFRPWIHNVMLNPESAAKELSRSLRPLRKVFGVWMINLLAKATCWALNSFNPIPVSRGVSREVMSTFEKSADALAEGDNILIFPEKPTHQKSDGVSSDSYNLRNFYTGFAHVGKMYFDKTGKRLLFYPLYSDKDDRLFKIGEPVEYVPGPDARESKKAVAELLQMRMEALKES